MIDRCSRAVCPDTATPLERRPPRRVTVCGKTVSVVDRVSDAQVRRCTVKLPASIVVVPSDASTATGPVVAPAGTVVSSCGPVPGLVSLNVACTPLKVTSFAPASPAPLMTTAAPTWPKPGVSVADGVAAPTGAERTPTSTAPHVTATAARIAPRLIDPPPTPAPRRATTPSRLTGGAGDSRQLTARGVDLSAAGVTHSRTDAVAAENSDELPLDVGVRRRPHGPGRRVERDDVDVSEAALEQRAERMCPVGLVVDLPDQRVLDRHPATGVRRVTPGGVEHLGDLPTRVHGDERVAQLVVRRVQ